jgi:hypothetical protein
MKDPLAELMTQRVEDVSRQIQELLHGLGNRTQGAILADLVSLWIAGHWDPDELRAGDAGRATFKVRAQALQEWHNLVIKLLPESEKEMMRRITPKGRA